MSARALSAFAALVRRRTGIVIGDDKAYLIEARLRSFALTGGYADVAALLEAVLAGRDPRLLDMAVDAMTTNETLFFRDATPFVALAEQLAVRAADPQRRAVRIWSAACSTGQEPYSIAMVVDEVRQRHPDLQAEIVASDLSSRCVAAAQSGSYSQFEVQRGVSMQRLVRHFETVDGRWKVSDALRSAIVWKTLNLTEPFDFLGKFDLIFCRNVLFYFDPAQRRDILDRIAGRLAPDGRLFLGASETPLGVSDRFEAKPGLGGLSLRTASQSQ